MRNTRWPITPYAARKLRKMVAECLATYRAARRKALGVKATGSGLLDREDAVNDALEARRWYWIYRLRLESRTVETGAAWCPAALERVRRANRSR